MTESCFRSCNSVAMGFGSLTAQGKNQIQILSSLFDTLGHWTSTP